MGENSKIEWTHHTFNPWIGCTKVSPGCTHCYAEAYAKRYGKAQWGPTADRVRTSEANWRKPLAWNRDAMEAGERRRVFCASLADVFEQRADLASWRNDLWRLIERTPQLDWLLLTKRPDYARDWLWAREPAANVWLGTSCEDSQRFEERANRIMEWPIKFLSCEPLLGPLPIGELCGRGWWVILGGESGAGARPCKVEWIEQAIYECQIYGIPCFVKQLGSFAVYRGERLKLSDKKGGDWSEWPEHLRVREFPLIESNPPGYAPLHVEHNCSDDPYWPENEDLLPIIERHFRASAPTLLADNERQAKVIEEVVKALRNQRAELHRMPTMVADRTAWRDAMVRNIDYALEALGGDASLPAARREGREGEGVGGKSGVFGSQVYANTPMLRRKGRP